MSPEPPPRHAPGQRTSDFEYDLPPGLIAQQPLPERSGSRLLVVRRLGGSAAGRLDGDAPSSAGEPPSRRAAEPPFEDRHFSDLASLIPPGDLLVLNSSKVRHARFVGTRPSGAPAEVLLISPAHGERWIAIGQPGSALRPGKRIRIGREAFIETLAVRPDGYREVRFVGISADEALRSLGQLPLPPYITRDPTVDDETRYQTVYAEREGSVAAPTAGLHFTSALLHELESRGVQLAGLDLEVGPGTFKPVEVEDPARHPMHPEWFEIPQGTADRIEELRCRGGRLWAVGTTVVRALESAATGGGRVSPTRAESRLLITPGFRFRVVDRLVTNFHLPRSTLLMLVAAFAGFERTMAAYRHAVAAGYRFYSYGDAMVIL